MMHHVMRRTQIDDKLVFSNHNNYIFHNSRGIESGSTEELYILQEFIQHKCGEKRLCYVTIGMFTRGGLSRSLGH